MSSNVSYNTKNKRYCRNLISTNFAKFLLTFFRNSIGTKKGWAHVKNGLKDSKLKILKKKTLNVNYIVDLSIFTFGVNLVQKYETRILRSTFCFLFEILSKSKKNNWKEIIWNCIFVHLYKSAFIFVRKVKIKWYVQLSNYVAWLIRCYFLQDRARKRQRRIRVRCWSREWDMDQEPLGLLVSKRKICSRCGERKNEDD